MSYVNNMGYVNYMSFSKNHLKSNDFFRNIKGWIWDIRNIKTKYIL